MAENNSDDAQEKTEEPTQRRIDKAKEDGQILTSKEVFVFANISMGLLVMLLTISYGGVGLSNWSTLFRLDSVDKLDDLIAGKLMDSFWLLFQSSMLVGVPIVSVNLFSFGFPISLLGVFVILFLSTTNLGYAFSDLVQEILNHFEIMMEGGNG